MTKEILKCINCNIYTLKEICTKCSKKTITTKPARFSLEDKTGIWRRKYKKAYKTSTINN